MNNQVMDYSVKSHITNQKNEWKRDCATFLTDLMCNKALRLLVVKKWDLEAEHLIWFGSEQQ